MSNKQLLTLWLWVIAAFGVICLPLALRIFWLAKVLLVLAIAVLFVVVNWAFNIVSKPKR